MYIRRVTTVCQDMRYAGTAARRRIASVIAILFSVYLAICVYSLYLKLRKEEKEGQVRQNLLLV